MEYYRSVAHLQSYQSSNYNGETKQRYNILTKVISKFDICSFFTYDLIVFNTVLNSEAFLQ
jgi:hypothetical protein